MSRSWSTTYKLVKKCMSKNILINSDSRANINKCTYRKWSSKSVNVNMATFKFSDYDYIGFDLDNTLLYYKVTNQTHLIYNTVVKYLIKKKGYSSKHLLKPLTDNDYDFMQKGLMLDFERGNILRISPNGLIQRACHGTKLLTTAGLTEIYHEQRWEPADEFSKDYIATWNGPVSEKLRNFLDYFDISIPLIFAKIVDTLDEENGKPLNTYNIWPDILEILVCMFTKYNEKCLPDYFSAIEEHPHKYLHKCSEETLNWLKEIKKNRITFLITGSYPAFVESNANYAFGQDWRSLFDIIVCFARKPNFFIEDRPFYSIVNDRQHEIVQPKDLKQGEMYIGGCWNGLLQFFDNLSKKNNPSCLYVGDNLLQDIYAPCAYTKCDTVAVIEEQISEGMMHHGVSHSDEKILNSKLWGSYFCLKESGVNSDSLWGNIIRKYSKLCIPEISFVTKNPIDYPYMCFEQDGKKYCGYYPGIPLSVSAL